MRNIEKLRNYFLGKDPQLKETMADNSLRLIGIPGREFVLRIELLRRLGELRRELTDKDTELEGLINNLQSALSSETLARQNADRDLSDRITTNANDIAAINLWKDNTDFVLADDLATALLNYYTKTEVDAIIAAIPTLTYEVVQALPTTNISRRTIYMVHPQGAEEPDYYNEYIYMGDTSQPYDPDNWELIGNTRIDLTNYYTKAEVDAELAERDDAIEDVADDLDVVAQHLDDVEEEVDDLYDNWPTATATGNPINVQDSSNLPIKDFVLLGNATQFTTTGKNLLNVESVTLNAYFDGANGNVLTDNTGANCVFNDYIPVVAGNTYIFKINGATTVSTIISYCEYDTNKSFLNYYSYTNRGSITITPTSGTSYIRFRYKYQNNYQLTVSFLEQQKLQVESGSTATTYEPYTGGTPAPNPDYPQDIHVVTRR